MRITKEIKKVCLYLRYSSDKQQETSIEGQDEVCSRYCSFNGYQIVGRYIDRALSARTNVKKRVEFLRMIEDAKEGKFDAIVVYKMDRFSRDQFTTALYTKTLTEAGVAILSAAENLNTLANDGGMSNFMVGIMNAFAVYYSDELSQKVSRGMRISAQKCQYNGGCVPIGYKIVDKKYVIDEETRPIAEMMFHDAASGLPLKTIMEKCAAKGINLKLSTLESLLRNEKYIGVYQFGDVRVEDGIPAIISKDLFRSVSMRLDSQKRGTWKRYAGAKVDYLLTGKLFCGECGSPMVGMSGWGKKGSKVYHYYRCNKRENPSCRMRKIRKDVIEEIILAEARKIYADEALQKLFIKTFTAVFTKIMRGTVDQQAAMENEISKLEERRKGALIAIADNPSLAREMQGFVESLTQQIDDLKTRLSMHKDSLQALKMREEDVKAFLDSVFSSPSGTDSIKSQIIDSLVQRVEITADGKAVIIFNILMDPVVSKIEKSPNSGDFTSLIRSDSEYISNMVDPNLTCTHKYEYLYPMSLRMTVNLPPHLIIASNDQRSIHS